MKPKSWVNAYAYGFCFFCLSALIALISFSIRSVFDPFEHNYAEGIILYQVLHIFNLAEAYRPIAEYPHIVFHYTPLYHVIANLLARTGLDSLVAARMISVAAMLGLGAACAALIWTYVPQRVGRPVRYAAGLGASAFALFAVSVIGSGSAVRSDMLGVALAVLGLWTFVRSGDRSPFQWLAFVLFTAAIYCKQTLISAPAACLIAALLISYRLFLEGLLVLVVLGGGTLAILAYATSGKFLLHIFVYNVNPFSSRQALEAISQHIIGSWPLFTGALAVICFAASRFWLSGARIGTVLRRSVRARALFCVGLFTLFGMALSFSTGKRGAAENYFLEWDAGVAVLGGFFVATVLTLRGAYRIGPIEWASLLLPTIWVLSTAPAVYRDIHPSSFMRARNQMMRSSYSQLIPLIRAQPGPVISEDMMLLVKADRPIPMEPAIFAVLAARGVLDEEPFLARLRQQQFSLIIVIHELEEVFTPPMARTVADQYHFTEQIGPFRLYRPITGLDQQGKKRSRPLHVD